MVDTTTLSTPEFMAATGATERQVNYWCVEGVFGEELQAPGNGFPRRWPADLVLAGRACTQLAMLMLAIAGHGASTSAHRRLVAAIVDHRLVEGDAVFIGADWCGPVARPGSDRITIVLGGGR